MKDLNRLPPLSVSRQIAREALRREAFAAWKKNREEYRSCGFEGESFEEFFASYK